MTPLAREWVTKAEADFGSARREYRARKNPNLDLVCFLCQQSAEKYLKARLQDAGIVFPKTHNLVVLLDLVVAVEPLWDGLRPILKTLTAYGVEIRYPGLSADRERARDAMAMARQVRDLIKPQLDITGP